MILSPADVAAMVDRATTQGDLRTAQDAARDVPALAASHEALRAERDDIAAQLKLLRANVAVLATARDAVLATARGDTRREPRTGRRR